MDTDEIVQEQGEKQWEKNLRPHQFQPGKSGNPGGRPKGSKTLKQFAKEYLLTLNDEEKLAYMEGLDKKVIWEMAEDKAGQGVNISGELTSKVVSVDE